MAKADIQSRETVIGDETVQCPYCLKSTSIVPAEDYRPIYAFCRVCGNRFIGQRIRGGIRAMKVESAPACDDPDRREIEFGLGDEE